MNMIRCYILSRRLARETPPGDTSLPLTRLEPGARKPHGEVP